MHQNQMSELTGSLSRGAAEIEEVGEANVDVYCLAALETALRLHGMALHNILSSFGEGSDDGDRMQEHLQAMANAAAARDSIERRMPSATNDLQDAAYALMHGELMAVLAVIEQRAEDASDGGKVRAPGMQKANMRGSIHRAMELAGMIADVERDPSLRRLRRPQVVRTDGPRAIDEAVEEEALTEA